MRTLLRARSDGWPAPWDVGLPTVMVICQVFVAPWLAEVSNRPMSATERLLGMFVYGSCVFVLVWRRRYPELVLGYVCLVIFVSGFWLSEFATEGAIPPEIVALFSLAAHRDSRRALAGVAAAAVAAVPSQLAKTPTEQGATFLFGLGLGVLFAALGQTRYHRRLHREEVARRVADAETERRRAAAEERERLARDLHDVAGHHLSAVVVHASAAARIADPALTAESLRHAASTGREVLGALGRLVDVVGEPTGASASLESLLPALAEGLTKLGVPVTLTVEGRPAELPPAQVEAFYRIVQESLTNAMRYGRAPVEVALAYLPDSVTVTVTNPCGQGVAGLGSGRGIAGMRERAAALGGTLEAGPLPGDGGGPSEVWRVLASVPLAVSEGGGLSWARTVDVMTAVLTWALPMVIVFSPDPDEPLATGAATIAVMAVLLALSSVLLLWRRTAPWRVLAGLVGVSWLWPAVVMTGWLTPISLWIWLFAWPGEAVAVASVAIYGARRPPRWLAAPTAGLIGLVLGYASVHEAAPDDDPLVVAIVASLAWTLAAAVFFLPFWLWGRTILRRRERAARWERDVLDAIARRTAEVVRGERQQIAIGLRAEVLSHTAQLVKEAERPDGSLTEIAAEGRAALAGMRKLLDVLDEAT
ncbi:histidine kinase [Actinocorallia longicatena]|uniref:histidine kinase n=1 Tax=Actinocorallia longicatena TaxID=111803 RepID=A0ABP6QIZ4_9ACTN